MKKQHFILILIFCCLCFWGCKKKQYLCYVPYCYCLPLGIAFTGFSEPELDTIILLSYKGGTNLSEQLTADTFRHSSADFIKNGDTVFLKHSNNNYLFFWQISGNTDYRLILPANGREYSITGSRKGPDADSFYSETECLVKATPVVPLINTHVNGQSVNPATREEDLAESFIFINK